MQTTMVIKKDLAIKAIQEEMKLKWEMWFHLPPENITSEIRSTCPVCAVGSVLRRHCFTKMFPFTGYDGFVVPINAAVGHRGSRWQDYIKGNYLGNLSILFETLYGDAERFDEFVVSDGALAIIKTKLVAHIEKEWPEEFTIDFDNQ